jgi:hypothetical protein
MKTFEIHADCIEDGNVTEWGIYDSDDNYVGSFDALDEAEAFLEGAVYTVFNS